MVKPTTASRPSPRRQLLYQTAQEEIRSYIIELALRPGDPLPPEAELAQLLGISRNSIREAVRSLDAFGILEVRPGSGLFVRGFSFDTILSNLPYGLVFNAEELTDLLEVRLYLEHATVERVLRSSTPDQIDRLRDLLYQMQQASEIGVYSADADRQFHRTLYENVDNRVLVSIMDIFWSVLQQVQENNTIPGPADLRATYVRHAQILEALENMDVHAMRAAVHRQHEGILGRLRAFQEQRESGATS